MRETEKRIPMPARRRFVAKYPLQEMEVEDS